MKFNNYEFKVCFGEGRYANGTYSAKATSEEEAIDVALSEICSKFNSVLPELDIEVSVELIGGNKYEKYNI